MESEFLANLSEEEKIAKLPTYIGILQNMVKELQERNNNYIFDIFDIKKNNEVLTISTRLTTSNVLSRFNINITKDNIDHYICKLNEFKHELKCCKPHNIHYYNKCETLTLEQGKTTNPNNVVYCLHITAMFIDTFLCKSELNMTRLLIFNKEQRYSVCKYIDELINVIKNEWQKMNRNANNKLIRYDLFD